MIRIYQIYAEVIYKLFLPTALLCGQALRLVRLTYSVLHLMCLYLDAIHQIEYMYQRYASDYVSFQSDCLV